MAKGRWARFVALGAAALLGALLPAGLAAGSHAGSAATSGDPSVVLLTLGSNDQVKWMTDTQAITTKNGIR